MKNGKLLIGAGALAAAIVIAGGWTLGVQPLLAAAGESETQLASVQQLNELQAVRLAKLEEEGKTIDTILDRRAELEIEIPSTPAMAQFLGELGAIEAKTGAKVTNVTSGEAKVIGAEEDGSTPATPAPTETSEAGEAGAADNALTTAANGMAMLPITVSATGSEQAVHDFLAHLQSDGRLLTILTITFGTDDATGSSRVDISGAAYVLPPQS